MKEKLGREHLDDQEKRARGVSCTNAVLMQAEETEIQNPLSTSASL